MKKSILLAVTLIVVAIAAWAFMQSQQTGMKKRPAFKFWATLFGKNQTRERGEIGQSGSVVFKDEYGQPKVVYHGNLAHLPTTPATSSPESRFINETS